MDQRRRDASSAFPTPSTSRHIAAALSSPKQSPKTTQKSSFGRLGGKKTLDKEKHGMDATSSLPDTSQVSPSDKRKSSVDSVSAGIILQPDSPTPTSSPSSVQLKEDLKDSTCLSSSSVQLTGVDTKSHQKKRDENGDENGDEDDLEDQDVGETLDRPLGPSLLGAARSAELNALYHSPPVKGKSDPSGVTSTFTDNTIFGEISTTLR